MAKLTKRIVDAAKSRSSDYFIWDEECLALAYASSSRASGAISFSTERQVGRAVTAAHPGDRQRIRRHEPRGRSPSAGMDRLRSLGG